MLVNMKKEPSTQNFAYSNRPLLCPDKGKALVTEAVRVAAREKSVEEISCSPLTNVRDT